MTITAHYLGGSEEEDSKVITINPITYETMSTTPIAAYFAIGSAGTYKSKNDNYLSTGKFFTDDAKEALDIIYYAFAVPHADGSVTISNTTYIAELMELKNHNVRVLLSIDGATQAGCSALYTIALDNDLIDTFASNVVDLVEQYGFDGIDLDWEYNPNAKDKDTGDTIYMAFDKTMHTAVVNALYDELDDRQEPNGTHYMLTSALPAYNWGADNNRFNFEVLNEKLDYLNIMLYDGQLGSEANPNGTTSHLSAVNPYNLTAPYGDKLNMDWTIDHYVGLGMSSSKLIIGCAGYGKVYKNVEAGSDPNYPGYLQPGTLGQITDLASYGSYASGTAFSSVIKELKKDSNYVEYNVYYNTKFVGSYLYNATEKIYVTYDSPLAISTKYDNASLVDGMGLMCWSYTEDCANIFIDTIINKLA